MASAERTYVDPSALLKLYIHEPASAAMNAWRARVKGALPITLHGRLEIANGISLAAFRKAITAAAHKLARIVYHLVRYGVAYVKETEAAYAEQVRARLEKQLRRRAKELGYELRPAEPPPVPQVEAGAAPTATAPFPARPPPRAGDPRRRRRRRRRG